MESTAEQMNTMAAITADLDDLGELFEFGDIDLNNIPTVDSLQFDDPPQQHSHHGTHPNTPFDEPADAHPFSPPPNQSYAGHEHFGMSQPQQPAYVTQHSGQPNGGAYAGNNMYQPPSMQQAYTPQYPQPSPYHFQQPLGYPPGHHVPPTPNSYEMHGETGRFMQSSGQLDSQQHALLEQRYQLRKDDAIAYTPMVSPAGTPQYSMQPEFTIPGAYSFSPLTSPMLHAQTAQQHAHLQQQQQQQKQQHQLSQQQQGYITNPSTAPSSAHASPIDGSADIDMVGTSAALGEQPSRQPRKTRRKMAMPRSVGAGVGARQSPATKPQKRKSGMLSSMQAEPSEPTTQRPSHSAPGSANLQMPSTFDSSEPESISPEPLSESLMGPPPRPGTNSAPSPALAGQRPPPNLVAAVGPGPAATPLSLLSGGGSKQLLANGQQQETPQVSSQPASQPDRLDDLSLPEAARKQHSRRPSLAQINTQTPNNAATPADNDQTPRLTSRKTPKLGPSSTPSSTRPTSATASPLLVGSPMSASTLSALLHDRKDPGNNKTARSSKKRSSLSASGSSKLVSPALVPKISPSIKPLLPEGTPLNSATQAILLASKSNYQNLLEGNHLPGVTYPDSLSSGLTSKRTSHKVAEQGRRNRINEALKEMQALIPRSPSVYAAAAAASANASGKSPLSGTAGGAGGNDGSSAAGAAAAAGGAGKKGDSPDDNNAGNPAPSTTGPAADGGITTAGGGGGADDAEGKDRDDPSGKSHSSKAATVEMANEYIRKMQKDAAAQSADLALLRRENEELRRRLGMSAGPVSSASVGVGAGNEKEGARAVDGGVAVDGDDAGNRDWDLDIEDQEDEEESGGGDQEEASVSNLGRGTRTRANRVVEMRGVEMAAE